jgi:hypothetical protein
MIRKYPILTRTRFYTIWCGMKYRCENPNSQDYNRYGGRGIKISESWHDFMNFYNDMNQTYKKNLEIERLDNDGDYCKENCVWADRRTQNNNSSHARKITFNGMTKSVSQWAEYIGIKYRTLLGRISNGWEISKALSPIVRYQHRRDTI